MNRRFPSSFYNPLSLAGAAVAGVSFGLILFLMLLELLSGEQKPYMGIIAFVILPGFLLLGLAVLFWGAWRQHKLRREGLAAEMVLPRIDLNEPRQRRAFLTIAVGGLLLLLFSAFGSYKAYEYTDSDSFCGETCHTVMHPEFTAYQYSPHARVGCVQCHIGSGATWFVRSKLSGSYQVYATLFNKYPRPIPTPIENLRPAQETCEQCHWPKHFFSEKRLVNTYYLSDEQNTKWSLNLLVKIGGGNIDAGPTSGIHWHMNIANEVTYAALDTQRQKIAWVRSRTGDGVETLYRSTEFDVTPEDSVSLRIRRMDCVDCHNRPTHIYHPPARAVNRAMALGWVDPRLPSIKSVCVSALEGDYATNEEAMAGITASIREFYQSSFPALASSRSAEIDRAVRETQKIYSRNYFPEMKVSWRTHIDNIGHLYSPGCFRCHDGKHATDDGKVLSRDCNICHTVLAQDFEKGDQRVSLSGIEYRHPVDIGDAWKEMQCSGCHGPQ